MTFTRDHLRRLAEVAYARDLGFVELVGLAELDPAEAFKGADIGGADFRDQDLAGFDFTGAKFIDCRWRGANLSLTKGVTPATLADSDYDETTVLPPALRTALRAAFWATGHPPSWAEDWGHDTYGPWVTFRVPGTEVTQRMRWCPPGRFTMGSPEAEPGHWDDEGPQHEVTVAQGFWMFETACPEALWEAMMAPLQSRRGSAFPAVGVSWNDAEIFARRLNKKLPGLWIGLPSEARWEYACRAGTDTPYSFGTRVTQEQVNFNGNGPVAVASLPPNSWGLHEMCGNVWEWCEDAWHAGYDDAPADDVAPPGRRPAGRVIRGGSWLDLARNVRAACRSGRVPVGRFGDVGFRCTRGRRVSGAALAEPARGRERGAPPPAGDAGVATERSGGRKILVPRTPRPAPPAPEKPDWANHFGTDGFGPYAILDFHVRGGAPVTQRLRLIPPGQFWMGSPKREPGRFDSEGPRHKVTIERGFWLFDTPCTQAVWQAVMGANPSRFNDPNRPVETVSFDDIQAFLTRLNEHRPGLNLTLPSEAQWEYACRAGTKTATYAGPIGILGDANAPVLDGIAWYGGNSGVDLKLKNGIEPYRLKGRRQSSAKSGTHPVKRKAPNPWGLYDMLGNVWEWCEDHWHDTYGRAPADGGAWHGYGAATRVLRGGSWGDAAGGVRAASRLQSVPVVRYDYIGFRCARASV